MYEEHIKENTDLILMERESYQIIWRKGSIQSIFSTRIFPMKVWTDGCHY